MEKWMWVTMGAGVVLMVVLIVALVQDVQHRQAEVSNFKLTCKVIGDSYDDEGEQGGSMRTIYQCPDGIIHIR